MVFIADGEFLLFPRAILAIADREFLLFMRVMVGMAKREFLLVEVEAREVGLGTKARIGQAHALVRRVVWKVRWMSVVRVQGLHTCVSWRWEEPSLADHRQAASWFAVPSFVARLRSPWTVPTHRTVVFLVPWIHPPPRTSSFPAADASNAHAARLRRPAPGFRTVPLLCHRGGTNPPPPLPQGRDGGVGSSGPTLVGTRLGLARTLRRLWVRAWGRRHDDGGERERVPRRKEREETPRDTRRSQSAVGLEEERQTWTTRKETRARKESEADRSKHTTRQIRKDTNASKKAYTARLDDMPYRPPHAREGAGGGNMPPPEYRPKGYGGGSSFGTTRGFGGDGRGATQSTVASSAPPTVFPKWKPSERVAKFTEEQIKEVRTRMNVTVDLEDGEPQAPPPIETFEDMNLHADIIQDIRYHDYEKPTPIQTQGIPVALSGRDILGCAQTGSGKTASFAIPMIQHCLNQPAIRRGDGPLAVVLAPTRELAQQIEQEVKAFSRTSKMRSTIVVGGTHMGEQRIELRAGVEIVVATPGRFIDHLHQGNTYLDRVSFIVLDEADRMLDMGFEPQILEVMKNLPKEHQTLLFSATMPPEVEELAGKYLNKPVRVKVGTVSTPTASVTQHLIQTAEDKKIPMLLQLCLEEQQAAKHMGHKFPLTIIFVERKNRCDEVADALEDQGLSACSLHGGKTQQERESALRDFRTGRVNICVATDVASRGLDVSGIDHVINLDLPRALEDYVHRIGRTGRAGASGRATSYYTERDSFIVGRIKFAISQAEKGNAHAFATGREARQKEREERAAFHGGAAPSKATDISDGIAGIKVDDQYKHMAVLASAPSQVKTGAADDAWGDDEDDF